MFWIALQKRGDSKHPRTDLYGSTLSLPGLNRRISMAVHLGTIAWVEAFGKGIKWLVFAMKRSAGWFRTAILAGHHNETSRCCFVVDLGQLFLRDSEQVLGTRSIFCTDLVVLVHSM